TRMAQTTEVALDRKRLAISLLAIVALVVLIRLAMPVGFGLFLGVLMAFFLQPLYDRLRARGLRPSPAGLICALGATLVLAAILAGLGYLILSEMVVFVRDLPQDLAPGGSLHDSVRRLEDLLRSHHVDPDAQLQKLKDTLAVRAGAILAGTALATG